MVVESLLAVGLDAPDRQAFKQHALPDGGPYWLQNEPASQFLFRLPLLAVQQSWIDMEAQSDMLGPFRLIGGYTGHSLPNGACSIERGVPCASLTKGLGSHLLRVSGFAARQDTVFTDLPSEGSGRLFHVDPSTWFANTEDDEVVFSELAARTLSMRLFGRGLHCCFISMPCTSLGAMRYLMCFVVTRAISSMGLGG
jgi:hypothetical protein